jgi:hypothetical protein
VTQTGAIDPNRSYESGAHSGLRSAPLEQGRCYIVLEISVSLRLSSLFLLAARTAFVTERKLAAILACPCFQIQQ